MTELDGTPVRDAADLQLRLALLKDRPVECHIFGYGPMQNEIEQQIEREREEHERQAPKIEPPTREPGGPEIEP